MRFTKVLSASAIALLVLMVSGCAATPRAAETILADIEAVHMPQYDWDREDDEAYQAQYEREYEKAFSRRSSLIRELYKTHPDHENVPELLRQTWRLPSDDPKDLERLRVELRGFIEKHPADTALGRYARASLAWIPIRDAVWYEGDVDVAFDAFEWYLSEVGRGEHDEETARMLSPLHRAFEDGSPAQIALFERLRDEFPGTQAATIADGKLRQFAAIGEPFRVNFTCSVTGKEVDAAALSGKVVLVDFWATWCPPCVAKMPELKELYQRYRKDGLEIVGISLDQPMEDGGLDRLREFVKENEISWPQWYLGKGWESEFSQSWGINAIPTLFVVDAQGVLRSTTVTPDELEETISEMLAERRARAAAGAEH